MNCNVLNKESSEVQYGIKNCMLSEFKETAYI